MQTETARLVMGLLAKNQLTQRDLSRTLGYSPPSISNIVNGKAKVSIPMAFALGSYFNQHDSSQNWTEKLLQARITDDAAEFMGKAERYNNLIKGKQ